MCILAMVATVSAQEKRHDSDLVDLNKITGAQIDESTVRRIVHVASTDAGAAEDPSAERGTEKNPCRSIREAVEWARIHLERGTPVKIKIQPGVYRESIADIRLDQGGVRETLLVIEGSGSDQTIWTGSDLFPVDQWKSEGQGLYSSRWSYHFGHATPPWGPKKYIGQRTEMVFIDNQPLQQRIVERYEPQKMGYFGHNDYVTWKFLGVRPVQEALDVSDTFAVEERHDGPRRITIRPSQPLKSDSVVEVSTRQCLANFGTKQNLVLRGIQIRHVANSLGMWMAPGTIEFSTDRDRRPQNILIEDCRFIWNNGMGLKVIGDNWTIRNSEFNYNGYSGITVDGVSRNIVFEDNSTNFNGWRAFRGGEIGWFTGGVKVHTTDGVIVRRHQSIGNTIKGFWFDIHCKNVYMEDCVLINSGMTPLMWEIGAGPYHARRILMANRKANTADFWNLGVAAIEDSIFYNNYIHDPTTTSVTWWTQDRVAKEYTRDSNADEHIRIERIVPSRWVFKNNIIMNDQGPPFLLKLIGVEGSVEPLCARANVPLAKFESANNLYFDATGRTTSFMLMREGKGVAVDFKEYAQLYEPTARWGDPKFVNPAKNDFRLSPESPWYSRRGQLPEYTMPESLLKQMQEFSRWSGYSYDSWPPSKEPD